MKTYLYFALVFFISTTVIANEVDINEGHLYHIEIEEQKIKSEQLKGLLESDRLKVWSNCFSDKVETEKVEKNEN